jgi:phosphopantetheine adenylyltransferase
MYPDRDSFENALIQYAKEQGIDGKKLVKDIRKKDDLTYKKMINKFNKIKRT